MLQRRCNMNNKYILLRHGETEYQAKKLDILYPKDKNPILPITKNGKKQIKKVANQLSSFRIDLIYCSDYLRAKQTAEFIAKELSSKIIFDKRLRDTNFGIFHGRPGHEYREFFSEKKQRFFKRPVQGENWNDVRKRVVDFITDIDKKYKNKTILIVSHADPLWLIAGYLKGLGEDELLARRKIGDFWLNVGQFIKL